MSTKSVEPAGAKLPTETIRFKVSARDLADKDLIRTSDPYVKVFSKKGAAWHLLGKSEVVRNVENVDWVHVFEDSEFTPNTKQFWKIEIWDHDRVGSDDLVGNAILSIDWYSNSNQLAKVPLSTCGTVTLLRAD